MALTNGTSVGRRSFLARAGLAAGATALAATTQSSAQSPHGIEQLGRLVQETEEAATAELRRILGAAAEEEGLRLNLAQMAVASKDDDLLIGAPAMGLERVNLLELRNGITQGMIYTQSSTSNLHGFYVVRAIALQDPQLGDQPVRVQMIRGGAVVAETRGTARISSFNMAPTARGLQARVGVGFVGFDPSGALRFLASLCFVVPDEGGGGVICLFGCGSGSLLPCE
jgi:hypothetical protein